MWEPLSDIRFLCVHCGHIINLDHVQSVLRGRMVMRNDALLPILRETCAGPGRIGASRSCAGGSSIGSTLLYFNCGHAMVCHSLCAHFGPGAGVLKAFAAGLRLALFSYCRERDLLLKPKEFQILALLMKNRNHCTTAEELDAGTRGTG